MRIKHGFLCILPLLIATAACSQVAASRAADPTPDAASIVGVWRAQMDGLPLITLTITNESGSLSGAVLFYLHQRSKGQPLTATAGVPEPLFNPKFDGQNLTFQVSHRRAHPPRTLSDAPVSFRLQVTGANKGGLNYQDETFSGIPMARSDY